ncbi:hypothetical protein ACSMXM_10940 [Pacificimonas sp. ICDLI1SI03]
MDSRITSRFFRVEKMSAAAPEFEHALSAALALGAQPKQRQRELTDGALVRLERNKESGAFVAGEVVRVQTENIPPEASDAGLTPLRVGGLGHAIAYRYHPGLKVLCIQFDNRGVSVGKFVRYLKLVDDSFGYTFEPLVTQDAWNRYKDGSPRKLAIALASPANLERVEGDVGALTDAGRRLGEIADAPIIRIEVSMGTSRGGFLDSGFVGDVIKYFTKGAGKTQDVRQLKATVKAEGVDGSDAIDFLDEKLSCRDTREFPRDDADKHYAVREAFLRACFNEKIDYITRVYGAMDT